MPQIFELFGYPVEDRSSGVEQSRKSKICPFMGKICDGGGNRNQTKITLEESSILRNYFDPSVKDVLPGICSINTSKSAWIVCPRRLLAFQPDSSESHENSYLQAHERAILLACGIPQGIRVGVWSEVYLRFGNDDSEINYHFDYLVSPLETKSIRDHFESFGIVPEFLDLSLHEFKRLKILDKALNLDSVIELPNLESPIIIEVMTASTSGSDTIAGTDIRGAFTNAILNRSHEAPGINKRQVWGRMVTQLFAKTALAANWNGKTVWVIQDELLKNIELTTRLKVQRIPKTHECPVNLAVLEYRKDPLGQITNQIAISQEISGKSGISFARNDDFTDILLPSHLPDKNELLKSILRRKLSAVVRL